MMSLVEFLETLEYLKGFIDSRLVDVDSLKTSRQGPVAVECRLVLSMSGRANTPQFACGQRWFKDV